MSVWTHVAATFRLDNFRDIMGLPEANDSIWSEIFGRECPWEADHETRKEQCVSPDKFLPCGSEGSLQISVWTNGDKSSLFRYVVSMFGDLRDFESYDDIEQWFNESCKRVDKFGFSVRQAVCAVKVEFANPAQKVFLYDAAKGKANEQPDSVAKG